MTGVEWRIVIKHSKQLKSQQPHAISFAFQVSAFRIDCLSWTSVMDASTAILRLWDLPIEMDEMPDPWLGAAPATFVPHRRKEGENEPSLADT